MVLGSVSSGVPAQNTGITVASARKFPGVGRAAAAAPGPVHGQQRPGARLVEGDTSAVPDLKSAGTVAGWVASCDKLAAHTWVVNPHVTREACTLLPGHRGGN